MNNFFSKKNTNCVKKSQLKKIPALFRAALVDQYSDLF